MAKKQKSRKIKINVKTNKESMIFDLNDWVKMTQSVNGRSCARLKTFARAAARDTAHHFINDKWDLDLDFIVNDMLRDYFGASPQDIFLAELNKKLKKQNLRVVFSIKKNLIGLTTKRTRK